MILKNEGKRFPQQDIYIDNNVAEIKSLTYVCKDRNVNHQNIISKGKKWRDIHAQDSNI